MVKKIVTEPEVSTVIIDSLAQQSGGRILPADLQIVALALRELEIGSVKALDKIGGPGQLQHAWMRCYAPKPARAVEYCARLAPEIQKKFRFSTAYCDVHTAVAPWDRVDYDPRVPGAGTFG